MTKTSVTVTKSEHSPCVSSRGMIAARLVVLAVGLLLLSRNLTGRFVAMHEWNSADWCMFARNHVEYGLGYTKLFCTRGDTTDPPAVPQRYLNHPPLLAAWLAVPLAVVGDQEWAGRTVPIAATLGSAWMLMVLAGRLHSPVFGLASGLCYVLLPAVAFFGRMACHEAPVEFFSLLMLSGYVQWLGLYGEQYSRSMGKVQYAIGAALGIGTGWATAVMAGLIWFWQAGRTASRWSDGEERRRLIWTTLIPGGALVAVVLHLLWGLGWDYSMFGPLFWSRSTGQIGDKPISPAEWLTTIWGFARANFSIFGIIAAMIFPFAIAGILRWARRDSPFRQIAGQWRSVISLLLIGLQGLIWMVVFKRQSYIHQYWQFHLAPYVAAALAGVVLVCHTLLSERMPRLAPYAVCLLILLPIPSFARSLDWYHGSLMASPERVEALVQLAKLVPPRVPVLTSFEHPQSSEVFGSVVSRFHHPIYAYYAHRPLLCLRDLGEIRLNPQGCPAYLLEVTDEPGVQDLARQLTAEYEYVIAGQYHLIFNLRSHKP